MDLVNDKFDRNSPNLIIDLPYNWSQLSKFNNTIGYCVFEGSKIHTSWLECIEQEHVKQVWVPSTHVKEACINAGVTKPIFIVPHGVDTNLFNPEVEPNRELKSDKFTFLYNGGWSQGVRDRKGLDILLRAFTEEFTKDEDVRLIAKINPVYSKPNYDINREIANLNLKPSTERAQILIINNLIPYELMPSIYTASDVLVSPSKAEGFGLNIIEAMSCGLPIIATNYGGHTDFTEGVLVEGKMEKATDENFFYEEALWCIPDQKDLQKAMRDMYDNRDRIKSLFNPREAALKYTWENSAKVAKEALNGLEKR